MNLHRPYEAAAPDGTAPFVPILYRMLAFEAFNDFSDLVESISCETSKTCQVRGSNPSRGASSVDSFFKLERFRVHRSRRKSVCRQLQ